MAKWVIRLVLGSRLGCLEMLLKIAIISIKQAGKH